MDAETKLKIKLYIRLQQAAIVYATDPWLAALRMLQRRMGNPT